MRIKFPAPERIFASVADLPTLTVYVLRTAYMELPSLNIPIRHGGVPYGDQCGSSHVSGL